MVRRALLLLVAFAGALMPGTENFNDGASLASKGWTVVSNLANTAAVGPDGSFAAKNSAIFGQGRMPLTPCATSARFMLTVDWSREAADNGSTYFSLLSPGFNPSGHGGTTDDWLIIFTSTGGGGHQVMTNGRGGVNVWNIPNLYPGVGAGSKVWRFEVVFSSGIMSPGNDGALYFGVYPGTRNEAPGVGPGPTLDGALRVWWGDTVGSLVLRYELTDLGLLNPMLIGASSPYDRLWFTPGGVIDNVEWEDFCGAEPPPPPPIGAAGVDNSVPCCASGPDAASGAGSTAGAVVGIDETAPLPEWTPQCAGGGDYPSGAPVTDAEDWTVA